MPEPNTPAKHTPGPNHVRSTDVTIHNGTNPENVHEIATVADDRTIGYAHEHADAVLFAEAAGLLAIASFFTELESCNDQRDRLALFDAKYGIKPGEWRFSRLFDMAKAAVARATAE